MLETPRLILRPFNECDIEAAHVWFSDREVFRFYTYGPYPSLEETAERIRQYSLHFGHKREDGIDWEIHELLKAEDNRQAITEKQLRKATIGEPKVINSSIPIVEYDPVWAALFDLEANRIRGALGPRILLLEHVGSTSVPGLAAKPIIDILLVISDTRDERAYVPDLEAAGYILRAREPDWHEHRFLKGPDREINLHCFSDGCPEIERMLVFRDWLRSNEGDRLLYERTKRQLAAKTWRYVQNYADAKTAVVEEILARAQNAADNGATVV